MSYLFRLTVLLLLPHWVLAQADTVVDYRRLQLGVVAGQAYQEVDFTPNADVNTIVGRNFGVALRYFDRQLVGFQAELSYDQAGWREDLGAAGPYERQIDYAELLILTQFSVGRGIVQPLLQLGPYLSVPLAERESLPPTYDPTTQPVNAYYGRGLPFRINYGLQAGLGFNLEFGPVTLQIDGRYRQGFSNLIKPGESQASTSIRRGFGGHAGFFYAW
ncbi:porin family protein [Neolewinella litorea]|uniref:PorT family protein n=1 Tax=Neolewinella litorea TaxID=2562452 RepID=A0A4V3XKD0_9BACT|nr:porin family protein [Neolewinella litorea]THH36493.1 PorT family protein [Neolewinella litorea]